MKLHEFINITVQDEAEADGTLETYCTQYIWIADTVLSIYELQMTYNIIHTTCACAHTLLELAWIIYVFNWITYVLISSMLKASTQIYPGECEAYIGAFASFNVTLRAETKWRQALTKNM